MNRKTNLYFIYILIFVVSACSSTEPYYNKQNANWNASEISDKKIEHRIYCIGDAGKIDTTESNTMLMLNNILEEDGANGTVLFLGDNIYPLGMPDEEGKELDEAKASINWQMDAIKNYDGHVYFLPGNHDWKQGKQGGLDYINAQEEYVEEYLNHGNTFIPSDACPGPEVRELANNTVLIVIDSQWWLHNWNKEKKINKHCEIQSRQDFAKQLEDAITINKHKKIIIALHHPIYSQGKHGGHYKLKDHLFPLTELNENLYIPLPIIGSIYPVGRKYFGSVQDFAHPKYHLLRKVLLNATEGLEDVIYVSGHEHNLQYFNVNNQHFVISGSGSKTTEIVKNKKLDFGQSHKGISRITYLSNNEVWLEMIIPDGSKFGKIVFRKLLSTKEVIEPPTNSELEKLYPITEKEKITEGSTLYSAGNFKRSLLGDHYRDLWATKFTVPVIDLSKEHGGLRPIKRGGGFQTISLRTEASNEKQYVFRSIDKFVIKLVPPLLENTFVVDLVQDQISASHPYAAITVPKLADAANVYHTNPKLVFVPKQATLRDFNEIIGGSLYLYEERPAGNWSEAANFGNSKKIVNTGDVIKKTQKNTNHIVDEQWTLRSRIFDVFINDWDRHDDQWRWATIKDGNKTIYRPIPRDRDQAYYKFDGFIPWLASRKWGIPKFQSFDVDTKYMPGLIFNARYFDRAFLSRMSREDFMEQANFIKNNMSDEIIENAIRSLPSELYAVEGERVTETLKKRRENLSKLANEFYDFIAKKVNVVGTNKDERFMVERLANGKVSVKVFKLKKDRTNGELFYSRVFLKSETNEIRLFGLGGKDDFQISGHVKKSILVRVIGGKGKDLIIDESAVRGLRKYTRLYDLKKNTTIEKHGDLRKKLSNNKSVNEYDRYEIKYNKVTPALFMGYNIDDGVFIGGGASITTYGFRKEPYSTHQKIVANYAIETGSYNFEFEGDYTDVLHPFDLELDLKVNAPNYVRNYFGYGNDAGIMNVLGVDEENKDFNRIRLNQVLASAYLNYDLSKYHSVSFGPQFEITDLEQNQNRITQDSLLGTIGLAISDFEEKKYAGAKVKYKLSMVDNKTLPKRGIIFESGAGYLSNLDDTDLNFTKLEGEFRLYYSSIPLKTTFAVRVGGAHNTGDFDTGDFDLYQSNTIGGKDKLRGYRNDRFYGKSSFYHSYEARIKLGNVRTYLVPAQYGIFGFTDQGRVWIDNDSSDKWHHGYGGGIWFSPFNVFALTLSYDKSVEEEIINVKFGFQF